MDKSGPRLFLVLLLGFFFLIATEGCHRDLNAAQVTSATANPGPDPPGGNLAPVPNQPPQTAPAPAAQGAVLGVRYQAQPQQSYEQYPPQQYPAQQTYPPQQYPPQQAGPPPPVSEHPEAPAPNYIWPPGYWYWGPAGYYWIPGAWCAPPYYGALWTPGYWGWYHNRWGFYRGYWGLHIGFYGGINY